MLYYLSAQIDVHLDNQAEYPLSPCGRGLQALTWKIWDHGMVLMEC